MQRSKCKRCGLVQHVTPYQRKAIRAFLRVYPWVEQKDIGILFNISQARISEIVRADTTKGGQ